MHNSLATEKSVFLPFPQIGQKLKMIQMMSPNNFNSIDVGELSKQNKSINSPKEQTIQNF